MAQLEFLKLVFLWLMLFLPVLSKSQARVANDDLNYYASRSYVILQDALFPIHHIRAKSISNGTGTDTMATELEIYNLLIPAATVNRLISEAKFEREDTLLVALSVLPNTKGVIEWQLVNPDTIATGKVVSLATVVREGQQRLAAYRKAAKPHDYRLVSRTDLLPIVQRNEQYWTPKSVVVPDSFLAGLPEAIRRDWPQIPSPYVLTQNFLVRSYATRYLSQADYVTINIKSPTLSSEAPWRTVRELLPPKTHYEYSSAMGIVPEGVVKGIFEFWSRPRIGSGVFEYKPGIGLLSGSYPDYFYDLDPSKPRVFFNYIIVDNKTRLR